VVALRRWLFGEQNRIGRRLIIWIVTFSSLITLFISVIQLTLEYRELRNKAESDLESVEIYVPSIAQSLWNFDDRQLQLALDALVGLSGIHSASIHSPEQDKHWTAGSGQAERSLSRQYPLNHMTGGRQTRIGTLKVEASLTAIYRKVAEHALTIIVSNGVKTFLVAAFMVLLIRQLITRRLEALASQLGGLLPEALPRQDRAGSSAVPQGLDEVDEIGWQLETTRAELHKAVSDVLRLNGQMLQRDRELQRNLDTLALLQEVVIDLDAEGRILSASSGWSRLSDEPLGPEGTFLFEYFPHATDRGSLKEALAQIGSAGKRNAFLHLRMTTPAMGERWLDCRFFSEPGERGELKVIRGVLHDVTSVHASELKISHMGLHDALTNLPNRTLLEDRLQVALRAAERARHKVAICFIDLDHFKLINDAHGHKVGDQLLVDVARRLRSQLREADTLSRWGGDEFVLLLPDVASATDALDVARKMEHALRAPIQVEGEDYRLTFSMGVALFPDDAIDADTLLAHADSAMYFSKTQGRNQICLYADSRQHVNPDFNIRVQGKLAKAVADRNIHPWFQPVVHADGSGCFMVEVLARWNDPELGWVGPATFIPIAEKAGLIAELGYQVWLEALGVYAQWRAEGMALRLGVNLSKRQLFTPRFAEQIKADLDQRGLRPGDIDLEITESIALLDVANAAERLKELDRHGFHLALDDFGTGFSSLSQLHEMPIDTLKIDISFVSRIHEPAGEAMTATIIQLARTLGMKTIAEGVEDRPTAIRLRQMGADYLQGYYFAKPMPAEECAAWLGAERWHWS